MKNFWKKFKVGLFTKSQVITGVTISLITTSALVYAFNQLSLNVFSPNTPISSAEVNANFEYLQERINYLAGNHFKVKSPYSSGNPLNLTSNSSPVSAEFDQVIVDFSNNGAAQNLINNGLLSVNQTGVYKVEYEMSGISLGVGTTSAFGSLQMQVSTLGTGPFGYKCCANMNLYFSTTNSVSQFNSSYTTTLTAGDVYRFMYTDIYEDNVDITDLKITIKEID